MSKVQNITLKDVRVNPEGLREVDENNPEFAELVQSVAKQGVLLPILVREFKDEESGKTVYGLIDGLQRYTAASQAGLSEIPAHIKDMEEAQILETQIIANAVKVETRPHEFAQQVNKILSMNPMLTLTELAGRLGKSTEWLSKISGLVKLDSEVAKLVDDGQIKLANAVALCRLPKEEQSQNIEAAMSQNTQEFVPMVAARVKEIREARRKGQDAGKKEFAPVAHMRKLGEIKGEIENPTIGAKLIAHTGIKKAEDAFSLALKWVMNLDPISIEVAKQKYEERQNEIAKKRAEAKAERAKKAAEAAAKAQAEAEEAAKSAG